MSKKRQTEIPGTEREANPTLDPIVERLLNARERRMNAKQDEDEATAELGPEMMAQGLSSYAYFDGEDRYDVTLESLDDKIRVKKAKSITSANGAADELAA